MDDARMPATAGPLPVEALRTAVASAMTELLVPGAVAMVAGPDGHWLEAFGTRTFGVDDPVTTDDHFRVGSVTKTMTATVVLQLAQERRLTLGDAVATYRTGIPNGDVITVAHLLGMRSGLASYTKLVSLNQQLDDHPSRAWTPQELVDLGVAEATVFAPGEGFDYSNTNTILAGLIAEQVTGQELRTLFQERIFDPLGLAHTVMPPIDDAAIPEPHPHGYMYGTNVSTIDTGALTEDEQAAARAGELAPNDFTDLNPSWAGFAGAAISTATDMAIYAKALVGGGLLDRPAQAQRLDSVQPVDPGAPELGYGLGLASFGPFFGHTGSTPGYQSFVGYDSSRELAVVVLGNLTFSPDGSEPTNTIARALIDALVSS